ncbi:hypothetical protein [Prosthecobacter sp.]|uniref:hypothetical protein n=1 Tax=Prosthecobacter sp. TaxID=1965333 RepID=UPI00378381B6
MAAKTQGRLAEARLTLGYNTQPFQGWCVAGAEWRKITTPMLRFTVDQTLQIFGKVGKLAFIISRLREDFGLAVVISVERPNQINFLMLFGIQTEQGYSGWGYLNEG